MLQHTLQCPRRPERRKAKPRLPNSIGVDLSAWQMLERLLVPSAFVDVLNSIAEGIGHFARFGEWETPFLSLCINMGIWDEMPFYAASGGRSHHCEGAHFTK